MKCVDYNKLCEKIHYAWLDECLDKADVFEAITREQFAEAAKQVINEFTVNSGDRTLAAATLLALCFGNLELRLFGTESDSE